MVRINIIDPRCLADQHLIAEYNEILMLFGYVKKYPELDLRRIPKTYCLGPGHILFFKNKLVYLKKRHELLKKEMRRRGFVATKTISLRFPKVLLHDWRLRPDDKDIIKKRIKEKIAKKPNYYLYEGQKRSPSFFYKLLSNA